MSYIPILLVALTVVLVLIRLIQIERKVDNIEAEFDTAVNGHVVKIELGINPEQIAQEVVVRALKNDDSV